jgi:serine/threonine protein kinase
MTSRVWGDSFEAGETLGHGNFSTVLLGHTSAAIRAQVPAAPAKVALKFCSVGDAPCLAALQREWEVYSAVNAGMGALPGAPFPTGHPHIAEAYRYMHDANEACIVLEFAPFGDLMSYLAQAPRGLFSERTVCAVTWQLLSAVKVLHEVGYAHRDVKPHNVFVMRADPIVVKLGDMGLVKQVEEAEFFGRQNSAGDRDFMAGDVKDMCDDGVPMRRHEYFKNDVYAVGLTMFVMLCGRVPTDAERAMLRHAAPFDWPPACTPMALAALRRLLSADTDDRPMAGEALEDEWFGAMLRSDSDVLSAEPLMPDSDRMFVPEASFAFDFAPADAPDIDAAAPAENANC